ncbi:MAG: hypothetical protein JXB49_25410 [Bacteroidales bacterium]|nr:hypothetical protein [Bacteroidales bacterium]
MMKEQYKIENQKFFERIATLSKSYFWPDEGHAYDIINGTFYGTKSGVEDMKRITPTAFHHRIKIKKAA